MSNKLELSDFEEAQLQLKEVEEQIEKRLKGTMELMTGKEIHVGCSFNRQWFRMDIYIGNNEYSISVQGRGGDINKYLSEMLNILKTELSK